MWPKVGHEEHEEDFGQTLAVWGIGEGLYLILPLLGPSNPRDGIGQFFVDHFRSSGILPGCPGFRRCGLG